MSLKPPSRRVSPLTMSNFDQFVEEDGMMVLRVPSMDSSITFSDGSVGEPWVCPQCSYSNVDSENERCALCGSRDPEHAMKPKKNRNSSWLSLGSVGNNSVDFRPSEPQIDEEDEKDDSELMSMPPPTPETRKAQTSVGLLPKGLSPKPSLLRPDREASDSDLEPPISLPNRYTSPQTSKELAQIAPLSPSGQKRSYPNSHEEQGPVTPGSNPEETAHSHDSTVRTSNRQVPPSPVPSPPATPPISNKSIIGSSRSVTSNSTENPERSISAPPLTTQEKIPLPALRQYHSDTSSTKAVNLSMPYQQPRQDDLEQASYLPASMRTKLDSGNPPSSLSSTTQTSLIPPARKQSVPSEKTEPKKDGKRKKKKKKNSKTSNKEKDKDTSAHSKNPSAAADQTPSTEKVHEENNASAHTQHTHRSSFASSFADEISVEASLNEHISRQAPLPLDVPAGDPDAGGGGGGGTTKPRFSFVCLVGVAVLAVAIVAAVVVALSVGGKQEEGPLLSTAPPSLPPQVSSPTEAPLLSLTPQPSKSPALAPVPSPPGGSAETVTIAPVGIWYGSMSGEQLGLSVSVGGPDHDWVAMGGLNFVRIAQLRTSAISERDGFLPIGRDLTNILPDENRRGLVQISMAQENRIAVGWQGLLTIYHYDTYDDAWNEEFPQPYKDLVSVAMSGNGHVVAATLISGGGNSAVHIFEYSDDGWGRIPQEIPLVETGPRYELDLSYNGDVLIVLSGNQVLSFCKKDSKWEQMTIGPVVSEPRAIALSGDGMVFAVSDSSRTILFSYNTDSEVWEVLFPVDHSSTDEQSGMSLALDRTGDVLVVTELETMDKPGTVSVWHRVSAEYTRTRIPGPRDSNFGRSVALVSTPNGAGWLMAVGAPNDVENREIAIDTQDEGSVHTYYIRDDTRKN